MKKEIKLKKIYLFHKKHLLAWMLLMAFTLMQTVNSQNQFLPSNYDEPFRGQFHFSQQSGWMNDINGLWYIDGVYHLTYQSYIYNLDGSVNGFAARDWGHATSTDLIHWTQYPSILIADGNVPGECWSGSTIIDFNNTSGFGTDDNPAIISFYTATSKGTCIAYSLDKGYTWEEYSANPVNIANNGTKPLWNDRDPKIFWHEPSKKWCCVIYEDKTRFTFYNSSDLKTWNKTSSFRNDWGYECPDFFELAVDDGEMKKYVLLQGDGDYFIGNFDGYVFTPDQGGPYEMIHNKGFGGGFYASQTFFQGNMPGNRVIQMGWMLGNGPGSTSPWTHNATFPCELKLKTFPEGIRVIRKPVAEIEANYESTQTWNNLLLRSGQNLFNGIFSKCFDLEVVLDISDVLASNITFQFSDKLINYNVQEESLLGKKIKAKNNQVKIRFLVDWGQLEVFGNDGEYSYVENVKFNPSNQLISMISNGNIKVVSAKLSNVKRTWPGIANNTYVNGSEASNKYTGDWFHSTNEAGYYKYDCDVATAVNSTIEFTFMGTQISWYGLKNDDLGMASVYIDDVLVKDDIDCYSNVRITQQLYTKTDLSDDMHTIKIVANGKKNLSSSGIALVHDYFGFIGKLGTPTAYDDTSEKTIYSGNWATANNDSSCYQGTYHKNSTGIGEITLSFSGSQIFWYAMKDLDLGFVAVYIDNILVADDIDCYAPSPLTTCLFAKRDLQQGNHTIKVVAKGSKNEASSGNGFIHDYFDSPIQPPIIMDDSSTGTSYTGEWVAVNNENMYYNNTCHYNKTKIAFFEQEFSGTTISWYGLRNDDLGYARIYIDGEIVANQIDCYSTDRKVVLLFEKRNLSSGKHMIKIEAIGEKNPASKGYALVHDYLSTSSVDPSPSIAIIGNLSFGEVATNSFSSKNLTIINTDIFPIMITNVDLPEAFSCDWKKGTLQPDESKLIPIKFSPNNTKEYSGEIKIHSNFGIKLIPVIGQGTSNTSLNTTNELGIHLYPNPIQNELFIAADNLERIEIFDITGKALINNNVKEINAPTTINMSNVESGVLIIKLTAKDKKTDISKFIKL